MPKTAFFSYCFFEDPRWRPRCEAARSFAAQQHPPQRKVEQKNGRSICHGDTQLPSPPNAAVKYLPFYIHTYNMAPTRVWWYIGCWHMGLG